MHLRSDRSRLVSPRALALVCGLALIVAARATATPFAPDSVWEAPLASGATLVPNSDALVGELRRQVAGPGGAWINTTNYSAPVYSVGLTQPAVHVALETYAPALQADLEQVPIPDDAVPSPDSDGNLVVYQPLTDTMWELWRAQKASDGWHAYWGGKMRDVSRNPGYFDNPLGASGTSLALAGGQITIAEMRAERIDHALAVAIPEAAHGTFVWPAQRGDGIATGAHAIPEGTRFRIDPKLDLSALNLSPAARIIAAALQTYGMVVRDQAGAVTLFGEDPAPYGTNPWPDLLGDWPNHVMASLPWDHLQAVVADKSVFREPLLAAPIIPDVVDVAPPTVPNEPAPVAPVATAPPAAAAVPSVAQGAAAAIPKAVPKAATKVNPKAERARAKAARLCRQARGKRASAAAKRRCRVALQQAAALSRDPRPAVAR